MRSYTHTAASVFIFRCKHSPPDMRTDPRLGLEEHLEEPKPPAPHPMRKPPHHAGSAPPWKLMRRILAASGSRDHQLSLLLAMQEAREVARLAQQPRRIPLERRRLGLEHEQRTGDLHELSPLCEQGVAEGVLGHNCIRHPLADAADVSPDRLLNEREVHDAPVARLDDRRMLNFESRDPAVREQGVA